MTMTRFFAVIFFTFTGCWATLSEAQQRWPSKQIRIVVPFPAGGSPDTVARLIGEVIQRTSGHAVVIDNKPGALGMLGADAVIREKPDGHTLLVTINSFFTLTPYVTKLTIDPMTEFLPIVETSRNTLVLTGNIAFPPKTLPELVSYVKANPGKVSFASYSPATVSHLAGLMLNDSAGMDMAHVGYKGTGPAQIDLIGGHIPVMVDAMSSAVAPIRDGRVRAYAVNSPARHPLAPAVPTFREMGYADLEVLTAWVGVFASKNTPKEIVSDIAAAIGLALQDEGVRTRMNQLGYFAPNSRSPQELREALQVEGRKLREIVAKKGITLTP